MKVLVTGGGGFLGFAIVEQLLAAGYEVETYSRSNYETLDQLKLVHHQASLTDYKAIKRALEGCRGVIHTAARVGMWGDYADFFQVNVTGTKNILRACSELHIPYLVYTSSPSVVYNGACEGKGEELPYPDKFDAYYPETKALAEQAVLGANGPGLVTCALRPHLIWGPGDTHLLPGFFERQRAGKLRLLGTGEHLIDTIYVDNAARAHVQALEMMQKDPTMIGGKAYFLSQDDPIAIREFINRMLATGGFPPVQKRIHPKVGLIAGKLLERAYRWFRISSEPPITSFVARQLSSPHWYDISAAKRDLGYQPQISIDEGMNRLKAWVETTSTLGYSNYSK